MTTKRYKLPDALGGAEVDVVSEGVGLATVTVGGVQLTLARRHLTEVPPPVPPQPEPGAYLIGDLYVLVTRDDDGRAFVHRAGGRVAVEWQLWWTEFRADNNSATADDVQRLVPETSGRAQLPELTDLPWSGMDGGGCSFAIAPYGDRQGVSLMIEGSTHPLSRAFALQMAGALIASAAASTEDGPS